MDQGSDVVAVPVDQRRRAALEVRKLDRLPIEIDVDTEVGQPVRELQRGIAKRTGQRVPQVGGCGLGSELEDQVTHGRPCEANVQQRSEEHERRGAERRERRPPDLLNSGSVERSGHEERRDHHEPERERVQQEHEHGPQRPQRAAPAEDEGRCADQAIGAHRQERHAKRDQRGVLVRGQLEEIVGAEPAESHLVHLQHDGGHICADDESALQRPAQTTRRKRKKQMQEQHRRQEVERLAQGEREVVRGP